MSILIQGFMLDTTWHIMPYYVTSILMASSFNIGVPLASSFGHGETRNIYTELLGTIHDQLNYSFEQKIIESDQGSALKSAINEYRMIHLACLRHLLVSLKFNESSEIIGELIKAESPKDYEHAKEVLTQRLLSISNEEQLALYRKILGKVGLSFVDGKLEGFESSRW